MFVNWKHFKIILIAISYLISLRICFIVYQFIAFNYTIAKYSQSAIKLISISFFFVVNNKFDFYI